MNVHLFGLPLNVHRRLKEESGEWQSAVPEGHRFRATPIASTTFSQAEVRELLRGVGEGYTHILIPASRAWGDIRQRIQFDCRVHIVRLREPFRDLTWTLLQEQLHKLVELDEQWLGRISPKATNHALLLPPVVFTTARQTADYWKHCDVYAADRFDSAEQLLKEVERHHRRDDPQGGRSWIDDRSRRFRIDPARHARSQADRAGVKSFRFCYEVPPGFHYDVTHESGKSFTVPVGGRPESVTHCNVTPWGYVRRG